MIKYRIFQKIKHMAKEHLRKNSTFLVIREIKMKTTNQNVQDLFLKRNDSPGC